MNKIEAIEVLKEFSNEVIADIYDVEDRVAEAIIVLKPNFEYPFFSCLKIKDFLAFCEEDNK